jgi:cytoskeletal protein CcmA (bactofilin family)
MHRQLSGLVVVLIILACLPGLAVAETRSGGAVTVGPNETLDDDLDAFGGAVVVEGTVDGDVVAFGGDIEIAESGTVRGDIETAGGAVQIAGTVDGDVNASGGTVTISESGQINGSLQASAGVITVDGAVGEAAQLGAESVRLAPTASLGGDLSYQGDLEQADGASVDGTVSQTTAVAGESNGTATPLGVSLFDIYGILVTLAVGAVLLLLFPRFSASVADRSQAQPLRSAGLGLAALVLVPLGLLLVLVTVIGIPLAVAGALIFGLLLWAASVYGRFALGTWLLAQTGWESRWGALVIGVLVVGLLSLVPVFGSLVSLVVLVVGLGALVPGMRARYQQAGAPTTD